MNINDYEFERLSRLIHDHFAVTIGNEKRGLLVSRLEPFLLKMGFKTFSEYYHYLVQDKTGQALITLANRITTNYSYFYREHEHLEFLVKKALPRRIAQPPHINGDKIHIWSAGCSSGEEPYTLSILFHDFFEVPTCTRWDLGILATDLDTEMLKNAHQGIYPEDRLRKLPSISRINYFKHREDGLYEVKENIKRLVHFTRYNLKRSSFQFKGNFFAIFCRNVMIYFDEPEIKALIHRFYEVTEEGGYLFIGLTESLNRSDCPYQWVAPSVYQKIGRR